MTEHKRKDGTPLTQAEIAEVRADIAQRKQDGITDDDICKEAGISLATSAAIAYGR